MSGHRQHRHSSRARLRLARSSDESTVNVLAELSVLVDAWSDPDQHRAISAALPPVPSITANADWSFQASSSLQGCLKTARLLARHDPDLPQWARTILHSSAHAPVLEADLDGIVTPALEEQLTGLDACQPALATHCVTPAQAMLLLAVLQNDSVLVGRRLCPLGYHVRLEMASRNAPPPSTRHVMSKGYTAWLVWLHDSGSDPLQHTYASHTHDKNSAADPATSDRASLVLLRSGSWRFQSSTGATGLWRWQCRMGIQYLHDWLRPQAP